MSNGPQIDGDTQENFVESREPAELAMCIVLGAAYAGLARYCWIPLQMSHNWRLFINVEGFFITITLLALTVGLRPYYSPCSLQVSNRGMKYRGPYWPQRKTVNWDQVSKIYVGPELAVVLYHPKKDSKGIWPLIIQSVYLSNREQVGKSLIKYSPIDPVILANPSWASRLAVMVGFIIVVIWFLEQLIK